MNHNTVSPGMGAMIAGLVCLLLLAARGSGKKESGAPSAAGTEEKAGERSRSTSAESPPGWKQVAYASFFLCPTIGGRREAPVYGFPVQRASPWECPTFPFSAEPCRSCRDRPWTSKSIHTISLSHNSGPPACPSVPLCFPATRSYIQPGMHMNARWRKPTLKETPTSVAATYLSQMVDTPTPASSRFRRAVFPRDVNKRQLQQQ
jgi:hypothetical protein